jgi:hypothetical protein
MRKNLLNVLFIGNTSTNKEPFFAMIAILQIDKKTNALKSGIKKIF